MESNTLVFNGSEYNLKRIRSMARTASVIKVSAKKINSLSGDRFKIQLAKPDDDYHRGEILFYRQEGKFTVIGGDWNFAAKHNAGEQMFQGRLIPEPSLKKARVANVVVRNEPPNKVQLYTS